MPKAIISSRILLDVNQEQDTFITQTLTYKIETRGPRGELVVETVRNYKRVKVGILSIPQGRIDLIPKGHEVIDRRVEVPAVFPAPILPLYPEQQVVHDAVEDSAFINALVGWGKTFTALWIAYKLGQKTLVVTHTSALRDQWVEEVESLFGFKPGIIGNGKFSTEGPIIIGNIQTLSKRVDSLTETFGTVIMDEAHHVPASTFLVFMDKMKSRYRVALSGTRKRKDGRHIMFDDIFSPNVIIPPKNNNTVDPKVKVYKSNIKLFGTTWAHKVNNLLYDEEYQLLIANIAKKYISEGHKVLVVADRTEFLENCYRFLEEDSVLITGTTKNRRELLDLVATGSKHCVWGARSIFSEGISENILSCVILAGPINNNILLEQLIGRIMRKHEDKVGDSIVVDINFSGPTEKRQNANRLAFYLEKGWDVQVI